MTFTLGPRTRDDAAHAWFSLRTEVLVVLASLAFTVACNGLFWRALLEGRDAAAPATWFFIAAVGVALTALQTALGLLVCNRWTVKPLLAVLVLATAFAVYYMARYGVYLDPSMLRNVLRTDVKEASELFTWGMVPHLLLYAGLPLLLLWKLHVKRTPIARAVFLRPLWVALALAVGVGALLSVFQDFGSLMRNRKEIRYLITPGNYLWSLASVARSETKAATRPREPVGTDAARGPLAGAPRKPAFVLFVLGETARAANWQLNGYARPTTPQLAAQPDVISFTRATSCGTNTEVSVPCLFSPWGRRQYDEERIRGSEGLLHVLHRAGVQTLWRDNQSGCKGVCDGLAAQTMKRADAPALCDGERCLDEVLLAGLEARFKPGAGDRSGDQAADQFVVLHMLGNHGPAYFRRYPEAFRQFTPTCDTPDLRQCDRQAIVNAYDNALLYTDHVLAQALKLLREKQATHDTALVYVSDHGESLGENNLFLHGVPYAIAPKVQTEVPLLMWLSPGFAKSFALDAACLRQRAAQPASHDHLFHTMLGLLDVRTAVRDASMDLASACRRAAP